MHNGINLGGLRHIPKTMKNLISLSTLEMKG